MKMTTFRKLLAFLAAAAMLVCVLAGCGHQAETQQTDPAPSGQDQTVTPDTSTNGSLVLSTQAALEITYGSDGTVSAVAGLNDHGIALADGYTDYTGKTCADAVRELIEASGNTGNLSPDVKTVIIKLAKGSCLPDNAFLDTVSTEAQSALDAAGSSAKLLVLDESLLDENGYIGPDAVKALVMSYVGTKELNAYYGGTAPTNNTYTCTVDIGGVESSYSIDAVTGLITGIAKEDLMNDAELIGPTEEFDLGPDEDIVYEETFPSIETDMEMP